MSCYSHCGQIIWDAENKFAPEGVSPDFVKQRATERGRHRPDTVRRCHGGDGTNRDRLWGISHR